MSYYATRMRFRRTIFAASIDLRLAFRLHVHLVLGTGYAVWIDSGVKSMYALLAQTMKEAGADGGELRFILHTHSHHDHMGCDA